MPHSETPLDPLSLRVVEIARQEAWRSAPAQTVAGRLWHWLLGDLDPPLPLANPRLELLRTFATLAALHDARSLAVAETILGKGLYSAAQLDVTRALAAR